MIKYEISWSDMLPNEQENATAAEKALSWHTAYNCSASDVAFRLETDIIPKKKDFEIRYKVNGNTTAPIIEGNKDTITIRRDFSISPTLLRALK